MMGTPGGIYDLLNGGHKSLIFSGAGSVLCSLTNAVPLSQGVGAMLPTDDVSYDAADVLRGIPSFIGISYDPDTGMVVSIDQASISISQESITLGRPVDGWTGKLRNFDGTDLNFRVQKVEQDRTVGVYVIKLSILKDTGTGRRIVRSGEGGV